MGNEKSYNAGNGRLSEYKWNTLSERKMVNGVSGKMVGLKKEFATGKESAPIVGGTTDVYFVPGNNGLAKQARLRKDGKSVLDLDWSHEHKNADGTIFHKGVVHVQEFKTETIRKDGKLRYHSTRLSANARRMTAAEVKKYGPLILAFNSNVIF